MGDNCITLLNGNEIPVVGFGTYQVPANIAEGCVESAIRAGYRHIDGAAYYENEVEVGRGIKKSGIKRDELFITSKVWKTNMGYDKTIASFERTISDLDLSYLDLFLIHWPSDEKDKNTAKRINLETWQALIDLYDDGKVKAIGVSNFYIEDILPLLDTKVCPMVNQIKIHAGLYDEKTIDFLKKEKIAVEAWRPLGRGGLFENKEVIRCSEKYGKAPANICIRYILQKGLIALPRTTKEERMISNFDVFGFDIDEEDMKILDGIEAKEF